MRGDYDNPCTGLSIEFDHNRDDHHGGHGLRCHVKEGRKRIASISLESLTLLAGSLEGKEGRKVMEWVRENVSMLGAMLSIGKSTALVGSSRFPHSL